MNLNGCTCGPYMSVIPPEPCPIHDPERAYWRMKLLQEFGGYTAGVSTTTAAIQITPKQEPRVYHYMHRSEDQALINRRAICGDSSGVWTRVPEWVTCGTCKSELEFD